MSKKSNANEEVAADYRRLLEGRRWDLEDRFPSSWDHCVANDKLTALIGIVTDAVRSGICKGMAIFRFENDFARALAAVEEGAVYCDRYPQILAMAEAATIAAPASATALVRSSLLFDPIFGALLSGRRSRCELIAKASKTRIYAGRDPEPDISGAIAVRAVALYANDEAQYQSYPFGDRAKKTLFPVYCDLIEAIHRTDEDVVNAALARAQSEYLARGKSRGDRYPMEYGGGKLYNPLCFDFLATGLAKIALLRGMEVTVDSEVIPGAFYRHWQLE